MGGRAGVNWAGVGEEEASSTKLGDVQTDVRSNSNNCFPAPFKVGLINHTGSDSTTLSKTSPPKYTRTQIAHLSGSTAPHLGVGMGERGESESMHGYSFKTQLTELEFDKY